METLLSTLALVTPGCTFMSFDFSDAYYACSIFPPHRKYFCFTFEGNLYEFTCLPNGLSCGPWIFTKLMKVALTHLREHHGITISGYLDDNIIIDYENAANAKAQGSIAANLFQELGFTINVKKSVIHPTPIIVHLGFIINSLTMMVSLTPDKTENILELINGCFQHESTIREVARIIGKIGATKPANRYAFLCTKQLEIKKNEALFRNKFNYDAQMAISSEARNDLVWTLQELPGSSAPVQCPKPDYTIYRCQ